MGRVEIQQDLIPGEVPPPGEAGLREVRRAPEVKPPQRYLRLPQTPLHLLRALLSRREGQPGPQEAAGDKLPDLLQVTETPDGFRLPVISSDDQWRESEGGLPPAAFVTRFSKGLDGRWAVEGCQYSEPDDVMVVTGAATAVDGPSDHPAYWPEGGWRSALKPLEKTTDGMVVAHLDQMPEQIGIPQLVGLPGEVAEEAGGAHYALRFWLPDLESDRPRVDCLTILLYQVTPEQIMEAITELGLPGLSGHLIEMATGPERTLNATRVIRAVAVGIAPRDVPPEVETYIREIFAKWECSEDLNQEDNGQPEGGPAGVIHVDRFPGDRPPAAFKRAA